MQALLMCSRYAGSTQHDMKSALLPCMLQVAEVMADAHARDVIIVDVGHSCDFADSMVIATGAVWACLFGSGTSYHEHCHASRSMSLRYATRIPLIA